MFLLLRATIPILHFLIVVQDPGFKLRVFFRSQIGGHKCLSTKRPLFARWEESSPCSHGCVIATSLRRLSSSAFLPDIKQFHADDLAAQIQKQRRTTSSLAYLHYGIQNIIKLFPKLRGIEHRAGIGTMNSMFPS